MNAIFKFCLLLIGTTCFLISCQEDSALQDTQVSDIAPKSDSGEIIPGQYIISFDQAVIAPAISYFDVTTIRTREEKGAAMEQYNSIVDAKIRTFLDKKGITSEQILYTYTALETGASIHITDEQYQQVLLIPEIKAVELDRVVTLPPFTVDDIDEDNTSRAQTTPCGITNAGGFANAGAARWIWIVDTGIDQDHPDLNVVTSSTYAKTFVGGTPEDCHGHGTHVSGTAAAINNTIGVVGVAANAPVVPIRIFNCSGSGSTSGIIAGLNHVATYDLPGDVVNMSLGGYYGSGCSNYSSYKSVVQALGNAGTRVCSAAGNSAANAALYQPACVNGTNVYTISSMTCSKGWSSFSNYNMNPVDYIATGSSVYSTYLNGGYATLSGTSMATPHVAGICQIRNSAPATSGSVFKNSEYYPIAVR